MAAIGGFASPQKEDVSDTGAIPDKENELAQVRALLLGGDPGQLGALQKILEDRQRHTEFVSSVLSEAIAQRTRRDDSVAEALATTLDSAIQYSVERNPKPLIDAVFPIIGPAIRKSISETLQQMLETLNHILEHQMSFKALRWRIEAYRSGMPYAEVVLLHSLVYQVEQILLIDNETGLLLANEVSDQVLDKDPGTVSAMLTAIRDFISDSFHVDEDNEYQSTRVGAFILMVDRGPLATIAAVVRGSPPVDFRTTLHETLENIHDVAGNQIKAFDGDSTQLEFVKPLLNACLLRKEKEAVERPSRMWRAWLVVLLIGGGLAYLGYSSIQERRAFDAVVDRLDRETGIVIVDAGKSDNGYRIAGLRDALSRDPEPIAASLRPDDVALDLDWKPYISVEPELVLNRIQNLFSIPETVELQLANSVLTVSGEAPRHWTTDFVARVAFVPGVNNVVAATLRYSEDARLEELTRRLETVDLFFETGSSEITAEQNTVLDEAKGLIRDLIAAAESLDRDISIKLVGQADSTGPDALNERLSAARAETVKRALVSSGLPENILEARGVGAPAQAEAQGEESNFLRRYRRVDFLVVDTDRAVRGGG